MAVRERRARHGSLLCRLFRVESSERDKGTSQETSERERQDDLWLTHAIRAHPLQADPRVGVCGRVFSGFKINPFFGKMVAYFYVQVLVLVLL